MKKTLLLTLVCVILTACFALLGCDGGSDDCVVPPDPTTPEYTKIVWNTGSAGENVTWTYYSDNTFEFTGYGAMYDDENKHLEWANYVALAKSVTISDEITTLSPYALYNAAGISSIDLPTNLTKIGKSALAKCHRLKSLTIPNSVTTIGEEAFYNCQSLTSVNIPDKVTVINERTFSECEKLSKVTIGNNVTIIYSDAFLSCQGLKTVYYEGTASDWNDILIVGESLITGDKLYYYSETEPEKGNFWHYDESKNAKIWNEHEHVYAKDGICTICDELYIPVATDLEYTLKDYYYIVSGIGNETRKIFAIPSTHNGKPVLEIGENAFFNQSDLTHVTIPDGITKIDDYAFCGCTNITSIIIPDSVTVIGFGSFGDCTGLTSITIGSNVTAIESIAFYNCNKLVEVINKSSLAIERNASDHGLVGAYALNVKTEGASDIVRFEDYLFYNYRNENLLLGYLGNDTVIDFPNYTESSYSVYKYAFANNEAITSVIFNAKVSNLGDFAFYNCSGLTTVEIGMKLETIGTAAFANCNNLKKLTVSENNVRFKCIGNCVIESDSGTLLVGCANSVIPSDGSVTAIGNYAFQGCKNLLSVTISDYVTAIGNYAFDSCTGLTSVTLGKSVTTIGSYAFQGCENLLSITVPDSVTSLGDSAFQSCHSLKSVTIGNGLTKLDEYVFNDCAELTSVTIPDGITLIKQFAFSRCSNLKDVTLGSGVTTIDFFAFAFCENLLSITIPSNVTNIKDMAFCECYNLVEVINKSSLTITKGEVENGYVGYYALNVKTDGTSDIATVNDYLFYKSGNVFYLLGYVGKDTELVLPKSYNGIEYAVYQYAFCGSNDLTSISVPDIVIELGDHAFQNCGNLTRVTIGSGMKKIHLGAFSDCQKLEKVYYKGTVEDWKEITTKIIVSTPINLPTYYYSKNKPTKIGNFWHYDEKGNIVVW